MASEKEISPQFNDGEIQVSKDATTGGVVDVDGDEDFSKRDRTVIEHARAAAAKEQKMTLLQGIKLYPKAIAWSMIISTCIVMEGYDISLVNNFCKSPLERLILLYNETNWLLDAFDQFNKKYGELFPDGSYQVPARWQSGLSNVSLSRNLHLHYIHIKFPNISTIVGLTFWSITGRCCR